MSTSRLHTWCHLAIVLLIFTCSSFAQERPLSKEVYEEIAQGYSYEDTKEVWVPKNPRSRDPDQGEQPLDNSWAVGLVGIFKIIGYALLAAIVLALIYFAIKQAAKEKVPEARINLDTVERIEDVDLQAMLDDALAVEDYRLALRLQYLLVLQRLAKSKDIIYRPHKTNRTYTNELAGTAYQRNFRQLSSVFEQVWYGEQPFSAGNYQQTQYLWELFVPRQPISHV